MRKPTRIVARKMRALMFIRKPITNVQLEIKSQQITTRPHSSHTLWQLKSNWICTRSSSRAWENVEKA